MAKEANMQTMMLEFRSLLDRQKEELTRSSLNWTKVFSDI